MKSVCDTCEIECDSCPQGFTMQLCSRCGKVTKAFTPFGQACPDCKRELLGIKTKPKERYHLS